MIKDDTQEVYLDTSTEEAEEDTTEAENQEEERGVDYWKAEALKNKAILERNKARDSKPKEEKEQEKKADGFGYDVKAYLKASGIQADEFDFVKGELKKAGGDIDSLIENEYFQAKLEKHRALNKTKDASVKGKRTGNVATDSVDYWLSKPFEEVPAAMRGKVLEAKEKQSSTTGKFYNS
jgi:hypothetical protein